MSSRIWKSIVRNRIVWAITAVISAFVIWKYVVTDLNPPVDQRILFTIEYRGTDQLFERYKLRLSSDAPTQIRMKVSGTYSDVTRVQDNAVLVVDVSTIQSPGEKPLKYTVQFPPGISSTPDVTTVGNESYLTLNFVEIKSKEVDVLYNDALTIEVGAGYICDYEGIEHSPNIVTIEGPAEIVDSIDHAQVSPFEVTEKLTKTTPFTRPIEFVLTTQTEEGEAKRLSDEDRNELTVDTETVQVTIPIKSQKEVELKADIEYGGGATENNSDIIIKPATVIITGDAETLSTIPLIDLGKIDLATYDLTVIEQSFEIKYPEGVKGDETEAIVTIKIRNVTTRDITTANISVINVPEGYSYEIETKELSLTLRGLPDILNSLEDNSVRAVVDLSGITAAGSVSVMANISVDGIENGEVGALVKDTNKVTVLLTKE